MTTNETSARTEESARTMVGKIVSDKMQKTVVVMVERIVRHHKYGKILRRRTKIHAHDENQLGKMGDMVRICEVRPISKTKCWKLVEVIS